MLFTVTGSGVTPTYHQATPLGFERCSSVAMSSPPPFTGPFPVLALIACDRHRIRIQCEWTPGVGADCSATRFLWRNRATWLMRGNVIISCVQQKSGCTRSYDLLANFGVDLKSATYF